MFKPLLVSGLILLTNVSASIAEVTKISSQGLEGLYTTNSVTDWDTLKTKLLSAYGGEVKEITFQELQDPSLKGANIATYPLGEIIILSDEETPIAVLDVLTEIFPDFKNEPLEDYRRGFTVTMQKDGSAFAIDGSVFKESKKSKPQSGGNLTIKFGDKDKVTFPAGTKILTQNEQSDDGVKVQTFNMSVPNTKEDARSFIKGQLDGADIDYQEIATDDITRFMFSVNDAPPSNITILQPDSDPNEVVVSVWITTETE